MRRVLLCVLVLAGCATGSTTTVSQPVETGPATTSVVPRQTTDSTSPLQVSFVGPAEFGYHDSLAAHISGCVEAANGSTDGLLVGVEVASLGYLGPNVVFVRDPDTYRANTSVNVDNYVEAGADGSFDGYLVAADHAPPGPHSVQFICARGISPPDVLATSATQQVTLDADLGGITFTPAVAHPGDIISWKIDCGRQASPGYTNVNAAVLSQTITTTVSDGSFAEGSITIPTSITESGTYPVSATCETQRIGTHRYPTGELTIQAT